MGKFLTFPEVVTRYEAGENAFDLTVEKWVRIRNEGRSDGTVKELPYL